MSPAPRSLAEDLRRRTDAELDLLLRLRPALQRPIPRHFAELAVRANTAAATIPALDDLTTAEFTVLEAACALTASGRFGTAELTRGLGLPTDSQVVAPLVDSLWQRALLWGERDDLRVPSAVREAMGREPCGLDPQPREHLPAVARLLADPDGLSAIIAEAPAEARDTVAGLVWGPASTRPTPASTWLVDRGVLIADDLGLHVLPREVALLLRGGLLVAEPSLAGPRSAPAPSMPADRAITAAGHAADTFLRTVDRILRQLRTRPVRRQASGAPVARDLDGLCADSATPPADTALVLDLCWTLRWLDLDDDGCLRPTAEYEAHLIDSRQDRWAALAGSWLGSERIVWTAPDRVLADRGQVDNPEFRRLILLALASGADPIEWLHWHRPRRVPTEPTVAGTAAEAAFLGVRELLPPVADSLATGVPSRALLSELIAPGMPALTSDLVLQADLTATALGPLAPEVEAKLADVADWESGGAAAVYRFTPDSVRRALAHGSDPEQLVAWLTETSRTPVPQALAVLIQDCARSSPTIGVQMAQSVLRCDPEVADRLIAHPELSELGLRVIVPGVLAAALPPADLIPRLRMAGFGVADSGPALAVVSDRPVRRLPESVTPERIVRSLRRVEERDHPEAGPAPMVLPSAPQQTLSHLATAMAEHRRLWLRFSDDGGAAATHLIEPLSAGDGDVCAFDLTAGEIRVIPLSRIVGLAAAQT